MALIRPDGMSDKTWDILEGEKYARRYEWMLPRIVGPVIDVGCAWGHMTTHIARLTQPVKAIDINPSFVRMAKRMRDVNGVDFDVSVGNCYVIDAPDGAFRTAVCSEVLEHLDSPDICLRELARVADRVVFSVPNKGEIRIPGHVHDFALDDLRCMAAEAGIEIVEEKVESPWQMYLGVTRTTP